MELTDCQVAPHHFETLRVEGWGHQAPRFVIGRHFRGGFRDVKHRFEHSEAAVRRGSEVHDGDLTAVTAQPIRAAIEWTLPMIVAVWQRNPHAVSILLMGGADPHHVQGRDLRVRGDRTYITPFTTACRLAELEAAQAMLQMEAFPLVMVKKVPRCALGPICCDKCDSDCALHLRHAAHCARSTHLKISLRSARGMTCTTRSQCFGTIGTRFPTTAPSRMARFVTARLLRATRLNGLCILSAHACPCRHLWTRH